MPTIALDNDDMPIFTKEQRDLAAVVDFYFPDYREDAIKRTKAAISNADQSVKLAGLEADAMKWERIEERLVAREIAQGKRCTRRQSASPAAVLGVMVTKKAAAKVKR